MTQPPPGQPEPGPWAPPPAGWSPQPPAPQWGQPAPSGGVQWPSPPGSAADQPFGAGPAPDQAPAPRRSARTGLVASMLGLVVLVGGGALTYVAFSDSSESGASSPRAAVQQVIDDLQRADLIGVLDDLAPGERDALANPIREDIAKLKELKVLAASADPSSLSGFSFTTKDLTFGATPITVNDHVQIVQITGGSVDVRGDITKIPFTDRFRKLTSVGSGTDTTASSHTDITSPVRIATVQVGGRWYPSIFYTAADAMASRQLPKASDAIVANGADSPEAIVRTTVEALLRGDVGAALQGVSPAELGAVHDYGGMLVNQTSAWPDTGVTIKTLDLTTTPISGGAVRVGLSKLEVTTPDGQQLSISIDKSCVTASSGLPGGRLCAADAARMASGFLASMRCMGSTGAGCPSRVSDAQRTALTHLFSGLTELGVATSEVSGSWFVNPVRSALDLDGTLLDRLQGEDLFALIGMVKN